MYEYLNAVEKQISVEIQEILDFYKSVIPDENENINIITKHNDGCIFMTVAIFDSEINYRIKSELITGEGTNILEALADIRGEIKWIITGWQNNRELMREKYLQENAAEISEDGKE